MSAPPIPASYWLLPDLLVSEYPADRLGRDPARLRAFLDAGITAFVDLTEAGEVAFHPALHPWAATLPRLAPYARMLRTLAHPRGLTVRYDRIPIVDVTVPTEAQMLRIVAVLDVARAAGHRVCLHCKGGTGRSGTAAACYLIHADEQHPAAALAAIRRGLDTTPKAHRPTPDTPAQMAFVYRWGGAEPPLMPDAHSLRPTGMPPWDAVQQLRLPMFGDDDDDADLWDGAWDAAVVAHRERDDQG